MLNVVVVGGGIAGLSAAISLRRAGHAVRIFERSAMNNEIGAAIHVCPNASRTLLAWGLDPKRAKFVTAKCSFRAKSHTMEKFHVGNEDYIEEKFGAPWFFAHRVDLHEELKRLATTPDAIGTPVDMHLKSEVACYNPDTPSVTLASGETVFGDLVIAADGIHSIAVETVLGHPNPALPQDHYNFCYRFLIPAADIAADPLTEHFLEGDNGRMKFIVGDSKRIVWYPCRNNEVHNFVAIFHNEDLSQIKKEDWQASVDKSHLVARFSDFHPSVVTVLKKATEVKQWALLYRAPIPTWIKGKLVLAGDTAHPMLPHQGQGGAQGIEDGIAIGIALAGATPDQIPARLAMYEKIRKNRASVMQIFSNAGQEEPERIREEASKYIPADTVPKNPEEFFNYNFSYDVVKDSVKQMKIQDSAFDLPPHFLIKEPDHMFRGDTL